MMHPDRRVFMISELIHNSFVNDDLKAKGLKFLKTAKGKQLIHWDEVKSDDIVITPAFGASKEDQAALNERGVDLMKWDATCRFVENVWFRATELGSQGYTIIIHGKSAHEETIATFSHAQEGAATVVIRDMKEAVLLGEIISGDRPNDEFYQFFAGKYSKGFDVTKDLDRIAVVNQTTMLASETAEISVHFEQVMKALHGEDNVNFRIANTRDTLCYATKNNQQATLRLLEEPADIAIVIGGRNSSNTSHLVELCEGKLPTYFIASEKDLISADEILHFDFENREARYISKYIPKHRPINVLLTSGASCPDAIVERVLLRLISFFYDAKSLEEVMQENQISS
ncbi:UNVERIFIED_CONTAM: hypothetical protein GTU68_019063 [Idotea baltica]|nr:hypothetical protein [Idotea baltica]